MTPSEGFVNPYNFVRPLFADAGRPEDTYLGRSRAPSHARYSHERWTGEIQCRLEFLAPFFIPDPRKVDPGGHQVRGYFSLDALNPDDGAAGWAWDPHDPEQDETDPALPATSLRGMVRSVFEAFTDSCYSIFDPEGEAGARDQLLPDHLHPCEKLAALCPACRLFGWVSTEGNQGDGEPGDRDVPSTTGRVKMSHGRLDEGKGVDTRCVTLRPLLEPKPRHASFYRRGNDQSDRGHVLRGRKFYRHHADVIEAQGEGDLSDTYVPQPDRERQNVNMTAHLVDGPATFQFRVAFSNLSWLELGGLLVALELSFPRLDLDRRTSPEQPEDGEGPDVSEGIQLDRDVPLAHHLGHGRPLGLGSCTVQATGATLWRMPHRYAGSETSREEDRRYDKLEREDLRELKLCFWRQFWECFPAAPGGSSTVTLALQELKEMLRTDTERMNIRYPPYPWWNYFSDDESLPRPLDERAGARLPPMPN